MRILAVILLLVGFGATAQFSGSQSVNAPFGARNAALGGKVVSLSDGDLTQFTQNPAVLDSVKATEIALNFTPYFAGIYSFSGACQADFNKLGKVAFGMTYLNYGDFEETADNGDIIGAFQAQDYVVMAGKSHRVSAFTLGANLKFAYSGAAGYGASMLMMDLGGIYRAPDMDFTVGVVFKNLGIVLSDYTGTSITRVPFDVQVSTSVKPEHMPFRFSVSAHSLTHRDLYFEDNSDLSTSRAVEIADKLLRHVNVGTELIIHQNVQFLFGYSHLLRQELRREESAYRAGFSYGLLIGIKKIKIRYTHATYHAAGGTDYFTLQANLNSFRKIL